MDDAEPLSNEKLPVFREELPDNCPPSDSTEITELLTVFRIVKTKPATENDFCSFRALHPDASMPNVPECQLRGLSVHTDKQDSEKILKLPRFKKSLVCAINLNSGAGRIKQTNKPSHHTWWPFKDYDILANC